MPQMPQMPQTHDVSGRCPVCDTIMTVTRLTCGACGTSLDGSFHVTGATAAATRGGSLPQRADRAEARFGRLARLDAQQLEFVETFLRCRGVIKNVEDMLGISYPTVKARLGNVLDALGFAPEEEPPAAERRARRREILADLAAGRITTEEAHQLLARNQSPAGEEDDDTD
ncbi:MAG TPA: DUF2089 domain-containing protein [Ktedonobacterales bacterium]|nr:DUF2089 domain-containing protein [Ktedonobacterales bacterium]